MTEYGSLATGKRNQLTFVRDLKHSPEKVWASLTDAEHVSAWFPTDIEGERKEGATLTFVFRENEGPTMEGEMRVYDPPRLLEFTWGDDVLRFELEPDGDGTKLTCTDTFDDIGKAARDSGGWHHCLDALGAHMDGTPPNKDRWREVHPYYVEHFPPEASTLGPPE